jgi:hypothetical protein
MLRQLPAPKPAIAGIRSWANDVAIRVTGMPMKSQEKIKHVSKRRAPARATYVAFGANRNIQVTSFLPRLT